MRNKQLQRLFHQHETYLFLITCVVFLFLSYKTGGVFNTAENLQDMVSGIATTGILAAGVLVILISGGIDISFMSIAAVVQYSCGYFMLLSGSANLLSVCLLGAAVGILLGVINGGLIYLLQAPAIIVTIATSNVYYGLLIWLSKGKLLNHFPTWFSTKSSFLVGTMPILLMLGVFLLTGILLRFTKIGRCVFAIGGNKTAAKRLGISVLKIDFCIYGYLGLLSAAAGLLQMYLSQTVAPNTMYGGELEVLAMVVMGGAALTGGRGTAIGTLIGTLLIGAVGNGIVLIGISSYWFDFLTGLIILICFCMTGISSIEKKGRRLRHGKEDGQGVG